MYYFIYIIDCKALTLELFFVRTMVHVQIAKKRQSNYVEQRHVSLIGLALATEKEMHENESIAREMHQMKQF